MVKKMTPSVWMFRPMVQGTNQLEFFLQYNRVAIGYPLGENLENASINEIYSMMSKKGWGDDFDTLMMIVKKDKIKVNDILVVPDDNRKYVYFCQVTSDYIYEKSFDKENDKESGFPHQRSVKWFFNKVPIERAELPEEIRASLRYPGPIANLTKHYDTIVSLIEKEKETIVGGSPLEEKALKIVESYLDNEDPMIRLRACEIILNK